MCFTFIHRLLQLWPPASTGSIRVKCSPTRSSAFCSYRACFSLCPGVSSRDTFHGYHLTCENTWIITLEENKTNFNSEVQDRCIHTTLVLNLLLRCFWHLPQRILEQAQKKPTPSLYPLHSASCSPLNLWEQQDIQEREEKKKWFRLWVKLMPCFFPPLSPNTVFSRHKSNLVQTCLWEKGEKLHVN